MVIKEYGGSYHHRAEHVLSDTAGSGNYKIEVIYAGEVITTK